MNPNTPLPETFSIQNYNKTQRTTISSPEELPLPFSHNDCNRQYRDGEVLRLPTTIIKQYDRNPRQRLNQKYQEIKTGIRERGSLPGALAVTRRPGESEFMLYMGGNTRLQIVQELWVETQNPAFEETTVTYVNWKSEADTLAAHLIENDSRDGITFWESAQALQILKAELELEHGELLSSRSFEMKLQNVGWSNMTSTMILNCFFALEKLSPIGNFITGEDVKILRRRINSHQQLIKALGSKQESYFQKLEEVQQKYASGLIPDSKIDPAILCAEFDKIVAEISGESAADINVMISTLAIHPALSGQSLRTAIGAGQSAGTTSKKLRQSELAPPHLTANISLNAKRQEPISLALSSVERIDSSVTAFHVELPQLVTLLCSTLHMQDCLIFDSNMPFGFRVSSESEINMASVPERRACFRLLLALTEKSQILISLSNGSDGMQNGTNIAISDLQQLFWHAEAGTIFQKVLEMAHSWRRADPERFSFTGLAGGEIN